MRLLLITQDFPPDVGGTQTYAYEMARRLAARCRDFAVVAPDIPGAAAVDAALAFDVVRVRASYDALALKAAGTVLRLARRRGFEAAFHVQWSTALASLLARPLGGPRRVFVAAHGREVLLDPLDHAPWMNRLYNRLRRRVLRRADGLFPVSHYTGALLRARGVPAGRITIVHNGTDPDRFRPMDATALRRELGLDGHRVLLSLCRLVPRKGIETVLEALPQVARTAPGLRYLVGGDGPDRPRLEALARRLGVSDCVRFLGKIPEVALPAYYNACDVFVLPAREDPPSVEGFGIVFLEAGACGKPVVGARSGGIPDAVRADETGLLVEPDDAPGLADALIRLLCQPELAARFGNNARQRVLKEATWDHAADRLYEAVAARL